MPKRCLAICCLVLKFPYFIFMTNSGFPETAVLSWAVSYFGFHPVYYPWPCHLWSFWPITRAAMTILPSITRWTSSWLICFHSQQVRISKVLHKLFEILGVKSCTFSEQMLKATCFFLISVCWIVELKMGHEHFWNLPKYWAAEREGSHVVLVLLHLWLQHKWVLGWTQELEGQCKLI